MKVHLKSPIRTLNIAAIVLIALSLFAFVLRGSTAPIEFGNDFTRDAAAQSILADRAKTIGQLEDVVKQNVYKSDKQEAVRAAIILLGKLRADSASSLLASHLSFFVMDDVRKNSGLHVPDPQEQFPAVGALINIGVPGVDTLLYQAANTDEQKDKRSIGLTTVVLISVFGKQPAIAFLTDVISEQREQKQKDRLNIILASLRKDPSGPRMNPYL